MDKGKSGSRLIAAIPDAEKVRARLAENMREARVLRAMLKLAEKKKKYEELNK